MTTNLLGLRVENYKRVELVNVEFPAEGGVVALMGENGAGKSSVLDALESTIAGRKAPKVTKPIHEGADSARIIATFDDIVVTRTYREGKPTSIVVKAQDGRPVTRAEDLLNKLYSHVALDPLAFSRLTDREQIETLLPLIGFDPAPLEAERKEAYELRTVNNREVAALQTRVAVAPMPQAGDPREEVSVADLAAQLRAATEHNAERARRAAALETSREHLEREQAEVDRLEAALAEARRVVENRKVVIKATEDGLADMHAIDTTELERSIDDAEATNARVRAQVDRRDLEKRLTAALIETERLTGVIADVETRKAAALAAAKMPVPNLSIDEDVLTLNGIPFADASTGEQIRTGTAIAMALNPSLRLIVIRDAILLDEKNRQVIDKLAKDNGFLVLMEISDESAEVGVVIEDGNVREVRS